MSDIFDEEMEKCKAIKRDDEVIAYAVGAGRLVPMLGQSRNQKKAMKYINGLDGFLGFNMVDLWHTLIIFDTLNNAKAGRNLMTQKSIPVGQIMPILVGKKYLPKS